MGRALEQQIVSGCELTVLSCVDYRLQNGGGLMAELRKVYGPSVGFDLITVPGSCHRLLREPEAHRALLIQDLMTAVSLHSPETMALVQHLNCGKYHSCMAFDSHEHEVRVLSADLACAAEFLCSQFPHLNIHGYIAVIENGCVQSITRIQAITEHIGDVARLTI